MSEIVTFDENSKIIRVKILDSTSTAGAGKTGLSPSSSGLIISTIASSEATPTAYTQAATHIETISTLGTYAAPSASCCRFRQIDATNHPGLYEIQLADARFAIAGAKNLIISISGVTGMVPCDVHIMLTALDLQDTDPPMSLSAGGVGSILDHAIADHLTAGTVGALIASLGGKMSVAGNQLIVYAADNATELFRFNLTDSAGDPTMTDVYTRTITAP